MDLVGPYLTKLAIDTAIVPGKADNLLPIAALFLLALLLAFVLRYAQNYIMQVIGQNVMYDLRLQIFSHLQYQSLSYFDRNPVGQAHQPSDERRGRAQRVHRLGRGHGGGRRGGAGRRGDNHVPA